MSSEETAKRWAEQDPLLKELLDLLKRDEKDPNSIPEFMEAFYPLVEQIRVALIRREALNETDDLTADFVGTKLLNILTAIGAATNKKAAEALPVSVVISKLTGEGKTKSTSVPAKPSKIATAIAVLAEHPDWSNIQIAEAVPCNDKYLSQSPKFKAARKAIRDVGRGEIPRGSKGADGSMESYDDF